MSEAAMQIEETKEFQDYEAEQEHLASQEQQKKTKEGEVKHMKPYCYIFGDPPGENTTGPDFFRMNHKHRVAPPQHCGNCKHFGLDYFHTQCCHPDITKFTSIGCCCNVSGYEVCDKWEAREAKKSS